MKGTDLKGKSILVTGASGFIGSHLSMELKKQGADVLPLTDQDGKNIELRDWRRLKNYVGKLGKIDLVYHLAAQLFVPYSFENPRDVYEVNVLGTLNVLELCRLYNIQKIVFPSSYVYGHPQYLPIDEGHPVNPNNPYARSKVIGEALCKAYHEDYNLNCTILRSFNIYGEGQGDRFLIPSIIKQLESGRIEIKDPEPRRDYLYISDAIEAFVKAGEYSNAEFDVFNIGLGTSYSVTEVVSKVLKSWSREAEVDYRGRRRVGEIADVVANIQKAREKLRWKPHISLEQGLSKYVEWHRDQLTKATQS